MKRNGVIWVMAVLMALPIMAMVMTSCGKTEQIEPVDTTPKEDPTAAARQAYQDARGPFVNEPALFDFDKYNIRPDAADVLNAKAAFMSKYTEVAATVEGHCDERGTEAYNMALGDRRAHAAVNFVSNQGVDVNRMSPVSFGESQPVDPGHGEEAWQQNRRAVFVITTEQSAF